MGKNTRRRSATNGHVTALHVVRPDEQVDLPQGPPCEIAGCTRPAEWTPILIYQPTPRVGLPAGVIPAVVRHPRTQQPMLVCTTCAQSPALEQLLGQDPAMFEAVFAVCLRQGSPTPDRRFTKVLYDRLHKPAPVALQRLTDSSP